MTSADGEDRLFQVPVVEPVVPLVKGPVDKTFRAYDPAQVFLMPPSIVGLGAGGSSGPVRVRAGRRGHRA